MDYALPAAGIATAHGTRARRYGAKVAAPVVGEVEGDADGGQGLRQAKVLHGRPPRMEQSLSTAGQAPSSLISACEEEAQAPVAYANRQGRRGACGDTRLNLIISGSL